MVWGLNTLLDVSAELYHQVLCQCIQVIVKYVFFFFFNLQFETVIRLLLLVFVVASFFFFLVGCLFFSGRGKKKIHCVSRSPTLYRYFQFFHPYLIIERFLIRFPVKNYFLEQVLFPVVGGSSYFFFFLSLCFRFFRFPPFLSEDSLQYNIAVLVILMVFHTQLILCIANRMPRKLVFILFLLSSRRNSNTARNLTS